jgi:hypothetical protein
MNLKDLLSKNSLKQKFTRYYYKNSFKGKESVSGKGSDLEQTSVIRVEIPRILETLGTRIVIDAPCGDFFWMKHVDLKEINYIGLDIVKEIISINEKEFGNSKRHFICKNIVTNDLPEGDVIIIRDCWVHLSNAHIFKSILNIKRSRIKYLLSTSFPHLDSNRELIDIWRPLNLELPPFNFPTPLETIIEGCTEDAGRYADKSLMLWEISTLPDFNIS